MNKYELMDKSELKSEYDRLLGVYHDYESKGLKLDMSRGKPAPDQLDLSMGMLDVLTSRDVLTTNNGQDVRNYGMLDGIDEAKNLFGDMLGVPAKNILVGGNSSLNLMYNSVSRAMNFGIMGWTPWTKLDKVKFLCPVPGYDRHFAICEFFGIEMINIPTDENGPDMDMVQKYVESDPAIKGIWCVPMYSNPMGITYSDDVVRRFAALKPAAGDFRIYWDNAYCVHHLNDTPDTLLSIMDECEKAGNPDLVIQFGSTSKISFSGAGIAVMAASEANLNFIKKQLTIQTIGFDKVNQLRHSKFFQDINGVKAHMKKHRTLLEPKFAAVISALDKEIMPLGIGSYEKPNGGYFISFNTIDGCAKRVGELCKKAGVVLTPVGATYPYGKDERNSNIRIAPTYPPVNELETAMALFCLCVKIATIEHIMQ